MFMIIIMIIMTLEIMMIIMIMMMITSGRSAEQCVGVSVESLSFGPHPIHCFPFIIIIVIIIIIIIVTRPWPAFGRQWPSWIVGR